MMERLSFLDKAPDMVLKDIIDYWQSISGRVLYPSQVENLEMHTLAYRESLLRNDIQRCAEQNLVEYAIGEHLDALGAMLACRRLQPTAAECRVQFSLDAPSLAGRSFPAGTIITTADGKFSFETLMPAYVISSKTESSVVKARCTEVGRAANGFGPGILCCLDPLEEGVEAANVTATEGGSAIETDGAYRERLLLAPASLGCGGTTSGYRYWARSASPLVLDAWPVRGAERGDIYVYVLAEGGTPSQELLAAVQDVCNSDDVRIINDYVIAKPALKQEYAIKAEITVYDTCNSDEALDRAIQLAYEYERKQRTKLGMDVTPTQIMMALSPVGERLYNVHLIEPAGIVEVGDYSFPAATEIEVTLKGVTRG
jgi:phage-related baseplate assembly protein